jgi:hypothetical protein
VATATNSKGTADVAQTMTPEQMAEMIAKLQAENAALAASAASRGSTSIKRSEKGAVSVYGLGRFPTTLYPEQWQKLDKIMPDVLAFIEANKADLSFKAPQS